MHIASITRTNTSTIKRWSKILEKHHIIFKSQGGLDFPLNYKYLSSEDHRGSLGPHLCKTTDDKYKLELEYNLKAILTREHYQIDELIQMLDLDTKQAYKAFKNLRQYEGGKSTEDIIRRLLGNWVLKETKIKW